VPAGPLFRRTQTHRHGFLGPLLAALALTVASFAVVTTGAQADDDIPPATRFAVGSPAMQVAQSIAQANWGVSACGGQVDIQWGTDDPNINARSYWANPISSYDNPDLNVQCRIVLNSTMTFTWPKFCTVLVHEYGHLTGHQHSADGPDVMSPIYRAPLPACLIADPSTAPAAAPAAVGPPATATSTTAAPASIVLDLPAGKATKRAKKATGRAARDRAAKSQAKARMAAAPLQHFSDPDEEYQLPWQPFGDED
jgi:hypothetical protein